MDDSKIVELYWERSESAIAETSKKYGKYCRSIALNILLNNEDADECVNDTYFRTWNSIPVQKPILLSAYLGKITRNLSLNKYKQMRAKKRGGGEVKLLLSELEDCIPTGTDVELEYEEGMIAKTISNFLRSLNRTNRIIFVRRYWYADSIALIAERYGMTESKVKSILFRIRKKLKSYLEKEGVTL